MKNVITNKYSYLALLCSLLLLSACATTAETKAASIEERASARWNSLLGGDLQGAYEFLSPGFRSSVSSLQYQRSILQNRVQWTAARYIESDCTETACKVKISLGYTLQGGLPGVKSFSGTQTVEESWVLIDGEWYYLPSK